MKRPSKDGGAILSGTALSAGVGIVIAPVVRGKAAHVVHGSSSAKASFFSSDSVTVREK